MSPLRLATLSVMLLVPSAWAAPPSRGGEVAKPPAEGSPKAADPDAADPDAAFFNDPPAEPKPAAGKPGATGDSDDALFSGKEPGKSVLTDQRMAEEDDTLQLGGFLYLQSFWNFVNTSEPKDHRISLPTLLELYLDGRPTDRLRGFVRGRLEWNPSVDDNADAAAFGPGASRKKVSVLLDELWLKFDIDRVVYVTVGQQKLRWGTTRIWNPVDVVNRSRREPLTLFDVRTGVPLLKLHFPVESLGWNFYLLGLMDEVTSIDRAGVAARAEFVVSTTEFALSGAWRNSTNPHLGFDFSAGLWDVDVMGEFAMELDETNDYAPNIQASLGLQWGIKYNDQDVLYVGFEYFWNQRGADSFEQAIYDANGVPDLAGFVAQQAPAIANGETPDLSFPQFFYAGQHYGTLFASLIGPGSWNNTAMTLSLVGNLSDQSFITRFDYSVRVLTRMSVQAWAQGYAGEQGELRLGPDAFGDLRPLIEAAGLNLKTPVLSVGLNLRIDI